MKRPLFYGIGFMGLLISSHTFAKNDSIPSAKHASLHSATNLSHISETRLPSEKKTVFFAVLMPAVQKHVNINKEESDFIFGRKRERAIRPATPVIKLSYVLFCRSGASEEQALDALQQQTQKDTNSPRVRGRVALPDMHVLFSALEHHVELTQEDFHYVLTLGAVHPKYGGDPKESSQQVKLALVLDHATPATKSTTHNPWVQVEEKALEAPSEAPHMPLEEPTPSETSVYMPLPTPSEPETVSQQEENPEQQQEMVTTERLMEALTYFVPFNKKQRVFIVKKDAPSIADGDPTDPPLVKITTVLNVIKKAHKKTHMGLKKKLRKTNSKIQNLGSVSLTLQNERDQLKERIKVLQERMIIYQSLLREALGDRWLDD